MGELYERILEQHPTKPKIAVHAFQAIVAEQRRGSLTVAQAQAILTSEYGGPLGNATSGDEAGVAEVQDLLATVPTGTTTANQLARIARLQEISDVLLLADLAVPPYDTPAALRTRLGVQTR